MIERIQQWTDESDRAVSPVIGVILMVAITVILAAVIGSFVLGIGGDISETPQVRLSAQDASGELNGADDDLFVIEHQGGAALDSDDLTLKVNNLDTDTDSEITSDVESIDDLSVGSRVIISETKDTVSSSTDIRIRVIHKPSNSLLLDTRITIE